MSLHQFRCTNCDAIAEYSSPGPAPDPRLINCPNCSLDKMVKYETEALMIRRELMTARYKAEHLEEQLGPIKQRQEDIEEELRKLKIILKNLEVRLLAIEPDDGSLDS